MKENIQGYIESLGFHVRASIPGLSISKKDTTQVVALGTIFILTAQKYEQNTCIQTLANA